MKSTFLTDGAADDRDFFIDALKEVSFPSDLTLSNNGLELMRNLNILIQHPPPHVIFLDLNRIKLISCGIIDLGKYI
ncbi:hypothetical protein KCTC52924_00855 [Arenibacter antarcticus]|uniref:Uncharacterized protein n=1 Tax=Arenibacter antarcticus TaxID=2040469 RepID=A0ABW5VE84_9FLAO|nr:hypothetical protein [Arenibacter sp. H213]MCM4167635.1 hypothetical protein [Arenibacter sp. H213]